MAFWFTAGISLLIYDRPDPTLLTYYDVCQMYEILGRSHIVHWLVIRWQSLVSLVKTIKQYFWGGTRIIYLIRKHWIYRVTGPARPSHIVSITCSGGDFYWPYRSIRWLSFLCPTPKNMWLETLDTTTSPFSSVIGS